MAGDRDEIAAPMNWMAEREAVVAEAEELTRARTRLWSYSLIGPGIWRVGSVDLIERLDGTAGPSGGIRNAGERRADGRPRIRSRCRRATPKVPRPYRSALHPQYPPRCLRRTSRAGHLRVRVFYVSLGGASQWPRVGIERNDEVLPPPPSLLINTGIRLVQLVGLIERLDVTAMPKAAGLDCRPEETHKCNQDDPPDDSPQNQIARLKEENK